MLQTYQSQASDVDPTPEVPESLRDPLWVVPKLNEIHRQHVAGGRSDESEAKESSDQQPPSERVAAEGEPVESSPPKRDRQERWSGGTPLVKTIVATRRGYDHLGLALAGEAYL